MATEDFLGDVKECLKRLQSGKLILYPTDTVWGIGADATNEAAVDKIFALKKRAAAKSMIVLLADSSELSRYVPFPGAVAMEYLRNAPKPTTVIYHDPYGIARNLVGDLRTVAIRIVKEPFCIRLITEFGKPIVSTSANISGQPAPGNFEEIPKTIKSNVDYVVKYRQNDRSIHEPSAVIGFDSDGTINILRP